MCQLGTAMLAGMFALCLSNLEDLLQWADPYSILSFPRPPFYFYVHSYIGGLYRQPIS